MNTTLTILAASLLSATFTCAQAQIPSSNKIETISITGTHSPIVVGQIAGSVTIIDQARIEASGALSINDLLRGVAGINIGQTGTSGSLSEVRFRGAESNHVLVLLDGVAINDGGQGGLTDFSHLLLSNIARIEILRGPQSAVWGSSAIAGIISITTKHASGEQVQGRLNVGLGNREIVNASAGLSKQGDKLGFALNASGFSTEGENISRIGTENDAYRNKDVSAKFNYHFNDFNRIDLNARLLNYTSDADAYDFTTGLVGDGDQVAKGEQLSLGLNWYFTPHKNGQKDALYSQLLSFQYSKQDTDNFSNQLFDRQSIGEKLRILWSNRFEFSAKTWLTVGLETTNEKFVQAGSPTNTGINQKNENDTWSIVGDGFHRLANNVSVSASVRYDNNDIFDDASSYRIGANYEINDDWRAFISQGKAIKNPTFVERFGFFPNSFLGNPNLTPEHQTTTELGIEGAFDNISIQVNWFRAALNNEILGFVFVPQSGQFTAQNSTEKSTREGIELSLQGDLQRFSWQAHYAYLDALQGNSTELRRSRHTGSLSTTYAISAQHRVYLQADYTGTKFDNFFPPMQAGQIVALASYWLASVNYQYKYSEHININVRVSNAFNANYEDVFGYNTDGRSALVNVTYIW